MRRVFTILLVLSAAAHVACSFSTTFFVVNDSGQPIEVSYSLKQMPPDSPFFFTGVPAKAAPQLDDSTQWRELPPSDVRLDRAGRVVTVRLLPGEALRIAAGGDGERGECVGIGEVIAGVGIRGASGEIELQGDQVHKSFVVEPKPFYNLSKNTTCALRYK